MAPKEIIDKVGENGFDADAFKSRISDTSCKKLHIVDVYTEWCGPCNAMVPTFKGLAIMGGVYDQFEDRVTIAQVERGAFAKTLGRGVGQDPPGLTEAEYKDEKNPFHARFPETSKPRFLFYRNAEEVGYFEGMRSPDMLRFIQENMPTIETDD